MLVPGFISATALRTSPHYDGSAYAPIRAASPSPIHRLATAQEQPQLDLAPIRPLAKLDGLGDSIVAAFIAGSVRRSCREVLTGSLSILLRCRETPQQQANSNDDEADRAREGFSRTRRSSSLLIS